jgi:Homeodomain-like domain
VNTSDLDDIAPSVGYRATRIIATWFGGRHLWVPKEAAATHPLAVLIGMPALRALVRDFGGKRLRVPTEGDDRRFSRNRQIAVHLAAGWSVERIGEAMGLTPRRVEQIRVELVRNGWLNYAHGFHAATSYPRGRRRIGRPEILGTGADSGEPPGGAREGRPGGSPELRRALEALLPA